MTLQGFLVLLAGALVGAGGAGKEAVQKEMQRLEGTWTVTALTADGKELPRSGELAVRMVFEGNKYTVRAGDKILGRGTYTVDPSQKPTTMELTPADGKGKMSRGIYELDGDRLKTCFAPAGQEKRPTAFASPAGSGQDLAVYKREKP